MFITNHESVFKILGIASKTSTPMHISGSAVISHRGVLESVQHDHLVFSIIESKNLSFSGIHESFTIRVYLSGHPMQMTAQLLSISENENGETTATFSFPTSLERKDARKYPRIAVPKAIDVRADFTCESGAVTGRVLDVSQSGVRIELLAAQTMVPLIGLPGRLDLTSNGEKFTIHAIPMWQTSRMVGLLLPEMESISDEELSQHAWIKLITEVFVTSVLPA